MILVSKIEALRNTKYACRETESRKKKKKTSPFKENINSDREAERSILSGSVMASETSFQDVSLNLWVAFRYPCHYHYPGFSRNVNLARQRRISKLFGFISHTHLAKRQCLLKGEADTCKDTGGTLCSTIQELFPLA